MAAGKVVRSEASKQRRRDYSAEYRRANKEVVKQRLAAWRAKPDSKLKIFAWYLRRTYGLTLEQHAAMLAQQNNRCGICGSSDPGVMTKGKSNRWHVDHDHATGNIRGLLCGPCNTGLGGFRDNPVALRNAALYVEKHRGNK